MQGPYGHTKNVKCDENVIAGGVSRLQVTCLEADAGEWIPERGVVQHQSAAGPTGRQTAWVFASCLPGRQSVSVACHRAPPCARLTG